MELQTPRLKKIFDDTPNCDRSLIPRFITSPHTPVRLHAPVTSEHGLKALQTAVRSNSSAEFSNNSTAVLLAHLRDLKPEHLTPDPTSTREKAPEFWNSLITNVLAIRFGQNLANANAKLDHYP